ncbi:MAG TPA: hypothetical protein VK356_02410 [Thermomicrobiales bacterium]|nr:hypothetical protein [Thermomicrobiales bacterium]
MTAILLWEIEISCHVGVSLLPFGSSSLFGPELLGLRGQAHLNVIS